MSHLERAAALTYPHGGIVTYGYDALNRMTSVSDWTGDTTTYSYDMVGNPTNTTLGNDTTVTRHFDAKGRLTALYNRHSNYSTLSGSKLTLDPVGNRTAVERIGSQWLSESKQETGYSYDNEDRIGTAGSASYAFTNSGRMLNTVDGGDITTYTHNARDRLAQINRGAEVWQFAYNGDGNRLQKSVNGQITRYVVDPSGSLPRVLAETDETGEITASYVYGAGLLSRVAADDSHHYYHFDHIGATTALTGEDGTLTDTYDYSVFGVQQETTGSTGNPFGYLGKYGIQNDENGLLYVRARYYDPDTGRFITKDAYAGNEQNSQSLNRFVYGLNSPISMVDVSGFVAQQNSSDISHQFLFDYFHGFVGELLQGSFEYFGEELAKNGLSALIAHLSVGSHLSSQTLGKSSAHAMMSVGPLLSFATAWRDAYKDTYANPHRDNVEAMARFSIDATVGSILNLGTAVGISAPVSIVAGAGYSQHREEIQNSILYNPATDWAGDQIYGNFHGTRFGGWLGLNP